MSAPFFSYSSEDNGILYDFPLSVHHPQTILMFQATNTPTVKYFAKLLHWSCAAATHLVLPRLVPAADFKNVFPCSLIKHHEMKACGGVVVFQEPSIVSGTAADIRSKINIEPTEHHHPQSSPVPRVITVPSASVIFKWILEVVFCEGVQQRLRFCLHHLICVKMVAFQFHHQSGKQRESRVGGGRQSCCFGSKINGEKGSMRRCVVMQKLGLITSVK
jgi:hypothetical protein